MKIVTAAEMQRLDHRTIHEIGIPGIVLMERAGLEVAKIILANFSADCDHIGIFCGKGNNGGDGMVVARHLKNQGIPVTVYLTGKIEELRGDARTAAEIASRLNIPIYSIGQTDMNLLREEIRTHSLLVDALFGTGLQRPLSGIFAEIIDIINNADVPVVAVDMPSGMSADTGVVIGPTIEATTTVTFGLPKIGLKTYPAALFAGELVVADIGIPPHLIEEAEIRVEEISPSMIIPLWRDRDPESHKGTYGHLLILSGSPGKTGAAALCGQAAAAIGAGLVTVGIPASLNAILEVKLTEAMTAPMPETESHTLSELTMVAMQELSARFTALAVGPGISTHPETVRLVRRLVQETPYPMILDADGISAFAQQPELLRRTSDQPALAITPHPGEMARLLGKTTAEVQQDRIGAARQTAALINAWVVLKGAHTVISSPDGFVSISLTGNPALASGGTGDVLTGFLSGLLAQGFAMQDALITGCYLHGLTADLIALKRKVQLLKAGDLIRSFPQTLKMLHYAMEDTSTP